MKMQKKTLLSVVICTYNRDDIIQGAIESLINQKIDPDSVEIIVVDNNSSDNTANVVQKYKNIKYVFESEQGLANARNRGYKEAKGEYVAYIDDDARADSEWLQEIFKILEKKNPVPLAIGGPVHPFYISKKPEWFKDEYEIRSWGDDPRFLKKGEDFSGSNMIFAKKILEESGGFDHNLGVKGNKLSLGEETSFFQKVWEKYGNEGVLYYSPNLIVYHLVPPEKMKLNYFLKRRFKVGQGILYAKFGKINLGKRIYAFIVACGYIVYKGVIATLKLPLYKNYKNWVVECIGPVVAGFGLLLESLKINISFEQYKLSGLDKKE